MTMQHGNQSFFFNYELHFDTKYVSGKKKSRMRQRLRGRESICNKTITFGEYEWRIYENFFHYFWTFSISLNLFQNKNLKNPIRISVFMFITILLCMIFFSPFYVKKNILSVILNRIPNWKRFLTLFNPPNSHPCHIFYSYKEIYTYPNLQLMIGPGPDKSIMIENAT